VVNVAKRGLTETISDMDFFGSEYYFFFVVINDMDYQYTCYFIIDYLNLKLRVFLERKIQNPKVC